jgi:hypothetical protein
MMLTDAYEIEADLIGQHALFYDIAKCVCLRERCSVRANRHVAEGIKPQFDRIRHIPILSRVNSQLPISNTKTTKLIEARDEIVLAVAVQSAP